MIDLTILDRLYENLEFFEEIEDYEAAERVRKAIRYFNDFVEEFVNG